MAAMKEQRKHSVNQKEGEMVFAGIGTIQNALMVISVALLTKKLRIVGIKDNAEPLSNVSFIMKNLTRTRTIIF